MNVPEYRKKIIKLTQLTIFAAFKLDLPQVDLTSFGAQKP